MGFIYGPYGELTTGYNYPIAALGWPPLQDNSGIMLNPEMEPDLSIWYVYGGVLTSIIKKRGAFFYNISIARTDPSFRVNGESLTLTWTARPTITCTPY